MNVRIWRLRNRVRMVWDRITHPWPIYVKVGSLNAVVNRGASGTHGKPGSQQNLGKVSNAYSKRWGVGSGQ